MHHYPNLFDDAPCWKTHDERLSAKTFELVSFLTDVLGVKKVNAAYANTVTYHDSCSGLREMEESEVCCGFGGSFCVKYPELSNRMVSEKVAHILASGADTVLADIPAIGEPDRRTR